MAKMIMANDINDIRDKTISQYLVYRGAVVV